MKITHLRLISLIEEKNKFLENLNYQIDKEKNFVKKIPLFKNMLQDTALFELNRKRSFWLIFGLYFMIYFFIGIIPANIDNFLSSLLGMTKIGIGIAITTSLIVGIGSMLVFGYYSERISKIITRKRLFIITNAVWIIAYGLISVSINYRMFLTLIIIGAIGTGAFLPIGFSLISDFYPPRKRGSKFGIMQFSLFLGNGIGIIIGNLIGWRFGYFLGFILAILILVRYSFIGMDPARGQAEPELFDLENSINYNYKITKNDLKRLFKIKSVSALLFYVLCSGIATSTLGNWAIFYLTSKLNSESIAMILYIVAGLGALPGAIVGGKFGDKFYRIMNNKGRIIISIIGTTLGILFLIYFYTNPFIVFGILGYFFSSFPIGNQFAIYSEVTLPEIRSTVNAMNGVMLNIGGIFGNLIISSLIQGNPLLITFSISLVLFIWLLGSILWIIPYLFYSHESIVCKDTLIERRLELEYYINDRFKK